MPEAHRARLIRPAGAVLIACVPLLIPVLVPNRPELLMFPYVAVLDMAAALLCVYLAATRSSILRSQWILFAINFFLRSQSLSVPALRAWTGWPGAIDNAVIVSWTSASATTFCLLAFTVVGRTVRPLKRWLDGGLAGILCGLNFLAIFSIHSSHFTRHYLQMSFVVAVFLLFVAQASHLSAATTGEQRFTEITRAYLLARVVLLFFNNIVNYTWLPAPRELPFDLLFGIPQICFLLLALSSLRTGQPQRPLHAPRLVVQNLLPSMILMGSMGLALDVFTQHTLLAGSAMLLSVVFFIGRTHLLYQRMLEEQQLLLVRAGYLEELASRDALTGIGNRRWLEEMGGSALAENRRSALLLVDTDEFKSINDDFGHPAGDDLLKMIADILLRETEPVEDAVCARLGGDEFVALLPGAGVQLAEEIADRIRCEVESHTTEYGRRTSTVSLGIATGSGEASLPSLLQLADEALYRAKSRGRNVVEISGKDATFFQPEQDGVNTRRFRKRHVAAATASQAK